MLSLKVLGVGEVVSPRHWAICSEVPKEGFIVVKVEALCPVRLVFNVVAEFVYDPVWAVWSFIQWPVLL
jgi:hypothetical protein